MSKDVKLWRYTARAGWDWAIALVTSAGELAIISDFGNYAFAWRSFGECFRSFLCQVDNCYLTGKLCNGRTEYDEDRTQQLIREHILSYRRDRSLSREEARCEWELSSDLGSFDAWYMQTSLTDAHEFYVATTSQQLMAFVEQLWPEIVKAMRADLFHGSEGETG